MIAIILARKNSKEIKNKNILIVNKKPLIYWTILACKKSKLIQQIYVSSDSEKILKIAKSYGAKIIKRPSRLSTSKSSSEEGWLHAINHIEKNYNFKNVIALQPTTCLRVKNFLDKAIKYFFLKRYDSMFSANIIKPPCLWEFKKKKIVSSYNYKDRKMRQDKKNIILENGSFFIFKKNGFKKNKKRFFGKIGFIEDYYYSSFQIDTRNDLNLIRILMNKKSFSQKIMKRYY